MNTCYQNHRGAAANAARRKDRKHRTQIHPLSGKGNLNQEGYTLGKI